MSLIKLASEKSKKALDDYQKYNQRMAAGVGGVIGGLYGGVGSHMIGDESKKVNKLRTLIRHADSHYKPGVGHVASSKGSKAVLSKLMSKSKLRRALATAGGAAGGAALMGGGLYALQKAYGKHENALIESGAGKKVLF